MFDYNVACCLCIRNCYNTLPSIFKNLDNLGKEFKTFNVVFVYDNCTDNSEVLLEQYKKTSKFNVLVVKLINESVLRTIRIAKARNACLKVVYNNLQNINFHLMIDADDVNEKSWNIEVITKYLNDDRWDILTFNRTHYYDIWALSYGYFMHHCWGFFNDNLKVIDCIQNDITEILKNLKENELFPCYSAFCGFGIYRTNKLKNIFYDGFYPNLKLLISDNDRNITSQFLQHKLNSKINLNNNRAESCEHLFYNILAIKRNKARVRIAKEIAIPN